MCFLKVEGRCVGIIRIRNILKMKKEISKNWSFSTFLLFLKQQKNKVDVNFYVLHVDFDPGVIHTSVPVAWCSHYEGAKSPTSTPSMAL